MIPLCGVENFAFELFHARQVSMLGYMQSPQTADYCVGRESLPTLSLYLPHVAVEFGVDYFAVQAQVLAQSIFVHAVNAVVPDLLACPVGLTPVGIEFERKRINVRGHVAGDTWVSVFAPSSANGVGLFNNREIFNAVALELHAHANT